MEPPIDKPVDSAVSERTLLVLNTIGRNIRRLRLEGGLTLQALAERTGLSPSMLSLLERGMGALLDRPASHGDDMVSRRADELVFQTEAGVMRRGLNHDQVRNIEIAINEYAPAPATRRSLRGRRTTSSASSLTAA